MNCPKCDGTGQIRDVPTGKELKAIRADLGLNYREMGEALGVSRTSILWWEKERRRPSAAIVARYEELKGAQ